MSPPWPPPTATRRSCGCWSWCTRRGSRRLLRQAPAGGSPIAVYDRRASHIPSRYEFNRCRGVMIAHGELPTVTLGQMNAAPPSQVRVGRVEQQLLPAVGEVVDVDRSAVGLAV